jgi:tetratricopeptide (TPR) repeat protein
MGKNTPTNVHISAKSTAQVGTCLKTVFLFFAAGVFFISHVSAFANPNEQGWKLLIDNKPLEAREIFTGNIKDKDKIVAGEAYRGLSEVASFFGEDNAAARYAFSSCLADNQTNLFSAGILKTYPFGRLASGASIKEGYNLLEDLCTKQTIYSGEFNDVLASRYLNDGKTKDAQRIVNSLGSIRNWMMIGPFDNISNSGFNKACPPEEEIDFSKTYEAKDGNMTKWSPLSNTAGTGWIFLENHTDATNAVFYFYCCVSSQQDRQVNLAFGASGSFKIFLNGLLVMADSVFRNTGDDIFMQRVTLYKGNNKLLVKLCHEWGGRTERQGARLSNFNLRFLDDHYAPAKKLDYSLTPAARTSPKVLFEKYAPSPLADSIFQPLKARLDKNEDDFDAALLYMNSLNTLEKTDEGQVLARRYLLKYPHSSIWHELYSESLLRAKKYTEGQTELKTAFSCCSLDRAGWENELHTISKTADARKVLEFIENSPPSFKTSLRALLATLSANSELENRAEALKIVNRIEEEKSLDYSALTTLAGMYLQQGEVKKAENLIRKYLEHERTNVGLYKVLASLAIKQGLVSRASDVINEALTYSPCEADLYYYLADMYYSVKKFDKARENIDKCCTIMPADANALNLRGNILISLNEKEKAQRAFTDAIQFTSDDFNAWENLRTLQGKPGLESMAALPAVDSLIKASANWCYRTYETGSVLSSVHDVFYYPSRCSRERTFMVVRLPTQKAIDLWKEKTIGYNSYFQTLNIQRALSYTANGAQVQADIMDNKIVFKSLQPGDCIVLEWSIKNFFMGEMATQVFGEEDFQLFYPVFDSWLRLITPVNDTVPYKVYGDSLYVSSSRAGDYRVTAFHRTAYKNMLDETFMATDWPENRKVCYSTFSDWGDIVKWYDDLTQHKHDNTLELRALADSLFAQCATPREKVRRMHEYITGNIRYSSVSFRQSDWIPQDAHDVLATKIGDCKDMSSLGKSLLTCAGVPAYLVLVNTGVRHFTAHTVVGPDFNHCILCYVLDGKDCFMDLTDNNLPIDALPKDDQGAMALIVRPGEKNTLLLPFDGAANRMKRRTITQALDNKGFLRERAVNLRTGVFAGQYREIFRFLSEEKKNATMRQILARFYPDMTLAMFEIDTMLNTVRDSLGYTYEYSARNAVSFSGSTAVFTLHVPDQVEPNEYPVEEKRNFPIDLYTADYDICSQETNGELTVPETWKPISLPQKVSLDSPFGSYLFEFSQKGKKILYHRKAVFNISKQIPVGDYERLKNFLNEVSKSDAVQLLFFTR